MFRRSPLRRSPYRRSPYRRSPYRRSPYSPYRRSPYRRSPYRRSPYRRSPYRGGADAFDDSGDEFTEEDIAMLPYLLELQPRARAAAAEQEELIKEACEHPGSTGKRTFNLYTKAGEIGDFREHIKHIEDAIAKEAVNRHLSRVRALDTQYTNEDFKNDKINLIRKVLIKPINDILEKNSDILVCYKINNWKPGTKKL